MRSEALLAGRLRALAHSLSDANLSGLPTFIFDAHIGSSLVWYILPMTAVVV